MMYNSQKSPAKKRKSLQIIPRITRDFSPSQQRLSHVSKQSPYQKQQKNLRYTFSAKSMKRFDLIQTLEKEPILEKKSSFENLRLAVMELQNKLYQANSEMFRKNLIASTSPSTKLLKTKQKSTTGFKNIAHYNLTTLRPTSCYQESSYEDYYPKNYNSRQTTSTLETNSFKAALSNAKPITKISQYITSEPMPENFHPITQNPINKDDKNLYYLNQILRASNQKNSLAIQHVNASIKMIKCCILERQKFNPVEHQIYGSSEFKKMFRMQRNQKDWNKKTLVLDLDQTLIHCYEDVSIPTDIKLKIDIQTEKIQVGVNIRPYALSFLKRMAKKFQIVIFTASHQDYANVILDQLDPDNEIFSHRFYRQHCLVLENGLHIKDLSYLPRDLKNIVLVDNAAYSYSFQLENGIPIFPYYEGKDFELIALEKYLQRLIDAPDVREINKKYFKLNQYAQFQTAEQLIQQAYTNSTRRQYQQ